MKWYKHISDSLDDPFIFGLVEEFGGDGYMVFFGVLEIYSREFSTKTDWILTEKLSYFRHKMLISCSRFKKIMSKITKWNVSYNGDMISIFIPKFKELMDESTLKKLREKEDSFRKRSGTVPKTEATDLDLDLDKDIKPPLPPLKSSRKKQPPKTYTYDFLKFYEAYPRHEGKVSAFKAWTQMNGERPEIQKLLSCIEKRKSTWTDPKYIPLPASWLRGKRWEDEISVDSKPTLAY